MSATAPVARSQRELAGSAELVLRVRAMREEFEALQRHGEYLRFEQRRIIRDARQQRETRNARVKIQRVIPSPWSQLPWAPAADDFEDILLLVG
jgi:hypothetical protein